MNRKKKRIMLLAMVAVLLFSAVYVSTFLVRKQNLDNIMTFGELKIMLINHTRDENGQEVDVNDDAVKLQKNNVDRIIKLKNICDQDMYVRIQLNMTGNDLENHSFDPTSYIVLNMPHSKWKYKDGWYYYDEILSSNETTENLLDSINFDINNITKKYPGSRIQMDVIAQAVQSRYNEPHVFDVVGWPEEE